MKPTNFQLLELYLLDLVLEHLNLSYGVSVIVRERNQFILSQLNSRLEKKSTTVCCSHYAKISSHVAQFRNILVYNFTSKKPKYRAWSDVISCFANNLYSLCFFKIFDWFNFCLCLTVQQSKLKGFVQSRSIFFVKFRYFWGNLVLPSRGLLQKKPIWVLRQIFLKTFKIIFYPTELMEKTEYVQDLLTLIEVRYLIEFSVLK